MAKKRVNELARQFDLPPTEIVKRLEKAGIKVKAAASAVDEDAAVAAITGKPLPNGNGQAKAPQRPRIQTGPGLGRPLGTGDGPAKPSTPVNPSARRAQEQKEREQQQAQQKRDGNRGGNRGGQRGGQRPTRSNITPPGGGAAGPGGVRRVVIDSQAARRGPGGPGGGPGPGPQRPPRGRGGRRRRRYVDIEPEPLAAQAAAAKKDIIRINSGSSVKEVAEYLQVSSAEIIKKLMQMGEMATLTQTLAD